MVKGLHDAPSVMQREKTTIRKGVIVRQKVWVDSHGQEMEKVGDQFIAKHSTPTWPAMLSHSHPYPHHHRTPRDEDLVWEGLVLVTFFLLLLTLVFLLGVWIGLRLRRPSTQPLPVTPSNQ